MNFQYVDEDKLLKEANSVPKFSEMPADTVLNAISGYCSAPGGNSEFKIGNSFSLLLQCLILELDPDTRWAMMRRFECCIASRFANMAMVTQKLKEEHAKNNPA
jgi:hypothetical protein